MTGPLPHAKNPMAYDTPRTPISVCVFTAGIDIPEYADV
jgi:hypothetical protein